jgi:hypothetical protein
MEWFSLAPLFVCFFGFFIILPLVNTVKETGEEKEMNCEKEKSGLVSHAERELALLLKGCEESEGLEMQKQVNENILELVRVFSRQGHSGGSAGYVIPILERLLRYMPLTPLAGDDNEWNKVGEGVFQNKRRSSVFKDKDRFDGQPYDIAARIFSDDGGKTWWSKGGDGKPVVFPYMPTGEPERVIVDPAEE